MYPPVGFQMKEICVNIKIETIFINITVHFKHKPIVLILIVQK